VRGCFPAATRHGPGQRRVLLTCWGILETKDGYRRKDEVEAFFKRYF
jgi:hypothetical protein